MEVMEVAKKKVFGSNGSFSLRYLDRIRGSGSRGSGVRGNGSRGCDGSSQKRSLRCLRKIIR